MYARMAALIRCHFRLTKQEMIDISEDDFFELWGQVKFYLETINQVNFS